MTDKAAAVLDGALLAVHQAQDLYDMPDGADVLAALPDGIRERVAAALVGEAQSDETVRRFLEDALDELDNEDDAIGPRVEGQQVEYAITTAVEHDAEGRVVAQATVPMSRGTGYAKWYAEARRALAQPATQPQPEGQDSLDAAWQEAEAALPEGALFLLRREDGVYVALHGGKSHNSPTPAAALRSLATHGPERNRQRRELRALAEELGGKK